MIIFGTIRWNTPQRVMSYTTLIHTVSQKQYMNYIKNKKLLVSRQNKAWHFVPKIICKVTLIFLMWNCFKIRFKECVLWRYVIVESKEIEGLVKMTNFKVDFIYLENTESRFTRRKNEIILFLFRSSVRADRSKHDLIIHIKIHHIHCP